MIDKTVSRCSMTDSQRRPKNYVAPLRANLPQPSASGQEGRFDPGTGACATATAFTPRWLAEPIALADAIWAALLRPTGLDLHGPRFVQKRLGANPEDIRQLGDSLKREVLAPLDPSDIAPPDP